MSVMHIHSSYVNVSALPTALNPGCTLESVPQVSSCRVSRWSCGLNHPWTDLGSAGKITRMQPIVVPDKAADAYPAQPRRDVRNVQHCSANV